MTLRERIIGWLRGSESRSSLENPATPLSFPAEWLLDIWNGGRTDSGVRVSEMTALQASVVFACVDLIASVLASLPLETLEQHQVDNGIFKRRAHSQAIDHDAYDLLRYEPNEEMSAYTFKKTLTVHYLLWGNAYAEIERDQSGRVVALWPRNPARTRPRRILSTEKLIFETTDGMDIKPDDYAGDVKPEERRVILPENMMHLPGLSLDGRIGQDVVWLARNAIGLSLATEKYAGKYFANGASPLGYLKYPAKLKPEDEEASKRNWQEAYGGENRHRTAILQNGMEYVKIGSNASEAQMIEARKQQWLEICPIFHVNPAMLGLLRERGSNSEQIGIEFVNYTLGPPMTAWEDELKRKVFTRARFGRNAGRIFIGKFDTSQLKMPDATSKRNYYSAGRQWGFLNPNDILEKEGKNPIAGKLGESYLIPVNMVPVDADGKPISIEPSTEVDAGGDEPDADDTAPKNGAESGAGDKTGKSKDPAGDEIEVPPNIAQEGARMFFPVFRDAVGRFLTREKRDRAVAEKIFWPTLLAFAEMHGCEDRAAALLETTVTCSATWKQETADADTRSLIGSLQAECRKKSGAMLYIGRHGNTNDDTAGLTSGPRNVPLDDKGKKDAARLAEYAAKNLPALAGIYAPNVKRHQQTMQAVGSSTGAPMMTDDELGPWRMGPELEGTPADGKIEQYKKNPKAVPPGGHALDPELDRTYRAIKHHLKMVKKTGQPRMLIMSHRAIRNFESKVSDTNVTENIKTGGLIETDGKEFQELI